MTQDTKVDWGAAIPTQRRHPGMKLKPGLWQWTEGDDVWCTGNGDHTDDYEWPAITNIRLPADHPYYTQSTPTNEVRERMEAGKPR